MRTILTVVLVLAALMLPAMGIDSMKTFGRNNLTTDPWMNQGPAQAGGPAHIVDGSTAGIHLVAGTTGQLGGNLLPFAAQNGWTPAGNTMVPGPGATPKGNWDGYIGGVPMAGLDSLYGPGGEPELKTTDPMYLAMGARPIVDQNSLPAILQGV
jgi:hypothetical protein